MSDQARLKSTIYVAGLDANVTKATLHDTFIPFGEIINITIPSDKDKAPVQDQQDVPSSGAGGKGGPHRGFGYVEFENEGDAKAAIDNMDQAMLAGRVLSVAQAKPEKKTGVLLGSKVAVWEQEDWIRKHEVSEEDRTAAEQARMEAMAKEQVDPMKALEGLDLAGPQPVAQ
ncbi:nuclear cap-binding protein [Ascodesmis nigricans]|uniref:Nuclear cap-binding protein n=1 Tax=Ascodesmis nigricans TaxID=341454 RepID=A0A4S2MZY0_9PEZI|nr:nuclear cap-binding protein [Ascodesmis nigricans]